MRLGRCGPGPLSPVATELEKSARGTSVLKGPKRALPSLRKLERRAGPRRTCASRECYLHSNFASPTEQKLKRDGTIPCPGLLRRLSPILDMLEVLGLGRFALAGFGLPI